MVSCVHNVIIDPFRTIHACLFKAHAGLLEPLASRPVNFVGPGFYGPKIQNSTTHVQVQDGLGSRHLL